MLEGTSGFRFAFHSLLLASLIVATPVIPRDAGEGLGNRQRNRGFPPSETMRFTHLTMDNGLSSNSIQCVLRDRRGFAWIGTLHGLNRYDGIKVRVFHHAIDDPGSLGSDDVRALWEDPSGTLWVATGGGGVNRYNPETEDFTRFLNPHDSSETSNSILAAAQDNEGIFWLGTHHAGLHRFDPRTGQFTTFSNVPDDSLSLSHDMIWKIMVDSRNNVWAATIGGGLNMFNRDDQSFTRYYVKPLDPSWLASNSITGICEDRRGHIWFSTYASGIFELVREGESFLPPVSRFRHDPDDPSSIASDVIDCLHIDRNQSLWFGVAGTGLTRTGSVVRTSDPIPLLVCRHNASDPTGLLGNAVYPIYEDNSGLFWIGSWHEGLNIYDSKGKAFRHYQPGLRDPSLPARMSVTWVSEDRNGTLWIGSWGEGLSAWDRRTDTFKNYKPIPGDPNSLSGKEVLKVYEDRDGFIWVGTYADGLNRLDVKSGRFTRYNNDPRQKGSVSYFTITSILEDRSGALWVGTSNGGLNVLDRERGEFRNINNNPDSLRELGSILYTSILLVDRTGTLWISAKDGGVIAYNRDRDEMVQYKHRATDPRSLSNNEVSCAFEDASGRVWLGTLSGGLNRFDRTNGCFTRYLVSDGLPSSLVASILEDKKGNLWLGTGRGLSRFDPETGTFRNFDADDGLPSNALGRGCMSMTGEMIFGTDDGFFIFHPDSIRDDPEAPPVYITDFYLFGRPVPIGHDSATGRTILPKAITESEGVELTYDDKVFSFEFVALDLRAPRKNRYAYMMQGFDKDWTYVDADRRVATYTNLNPGEYVFRVKGSSSDGIWNEAGASLRVTILPPWWRTGFAYSLYAVLLTGALYGVWRAKVKRLTIRHAYEMSRFEAQKLREVDEVKTRFFTNISHEFRTPLTLISGPAKRILEQTVDEATKADAHLIHRSSTRLKRLVDELLDIARIEAGEMKILARPVNLVAAVNEMARSFNPFAERKRIAFAVSADEDAIVLYADREKLDKILSNILANAFKFTPDGGNVSVRVRRLAPGLRDQVEVSVSDTGIGIPVDKLQKIFDRFYQVDSGQTREHEGTGIGLALTKELVELHRGSIEVESEEGRGSTFRLRFPCGKDHLKPEEVGEDNSVEETGNGAVAAWPASEEELGTGVVPGGGAGSSSLLIIEDNADVRKYVGSILEDRYTILEAKDGQEGLDMAFAHMPDLIISDIMMPKLDGLAMCGRLKTDHRTSHIPVIMLTARATLRDKISGLDTGADEYIMKPFEAAELEARIRNLLEQRKRLQARFRRLGFVQTDAGSLTSVDQKFLEKAKAVLEEHIPDTLFGVEAFAREMSVSRSLLFKKLHALVGEGPAELIRRTRLNHAAKLIGARSGNISEIALEVGFNNPSYFAECFKKEFGVPPSSYRTSSRSS